VTTNFGDLPEACSGLSDARIVVVPVPFDQTSTWIKGADKGPTAILEASAHMELYDIATDSEVYRKGIFTDEPVEESSPEAMVNAVRRRVGGHLAADRFTVVIGGEHSVSIGAIQAYSAKYPELSVLQLDAHADLRPEYEGSKYNHACVMARAKECCPIVQVGVRSMDVEEKPFMDPDRVFFAHQIDRSNPLWRQGVLDRLGERVYVTIDLDVFDSAVMPSTGTPEPGGLGWDDVMGLLESVIRNKKVVGFDVVELCPNPENKAPDFLAAKLIYKLLSYIFRG
jgi:agmatinase